MPEDTYKGNGRVRHERVNIQVSQFLNIQVHSYQSYEIGKGEMEPGGFGSEDHFDIYIYRNQGIVGGKPFEKISFGGEMKKKNTTDKYYIGHNEQAREKTLLNFIKSESDESEFLKHNMTNKLLSNIYLSIYNDLKYGNSHRVFKI